MAMEIMVKMYLTDWCLGNVMTVGVERRDFPTMMKTAQAEGFGRAGQSLDGDGEAAGQAGCFGLRRLECGGFPHQANMSYQA